MNASRHDIVLIPIVCLALTESSVHLDRGDGMLSKWEDVGEAY